MEPFGENLVVVIKLFRKSKYSTFWNKKTGVYLVSNLQRSKHNYRDYVAKYEVRLTVLQWAVVE